MLKNADFERPYELLERILIKHNGRKNLLARLGPEAEEGIDELLRMALEFERHAMPSLTGFLNWVNAEDMEVKRQFNNENKLLRIMTVHGAKGLEAPIVILPQTVKAPRNTGNAVLELAEGLATCGMGVAELPETLATAHQRQIDLQKEERMRLLYVAITRAESWLIVAGSGRRTKNSDNWYDPVFDAITALGGTEDPHGRLVLENNWALAEGSPKTPAAAPATTPPDWLSQPAAPVEKPPRPRSPSQLGGAHTLAGTAPDDTALLRGEQTHILLEHLAGMPVGDRAAAAQTLLDSPLEGVVDTALKTLLSPDLAHVFASDALREVPVFANLPGLGPISGRIDVLLVGKSITAIDFKSNPQVPARPEDTPEAFLRQLAAYRAALAQIWPERTIKTAILWSATQSLMQITPALTDAALKRAADA